MKVALFALNSAYIHTNLAIRYIAAALEDAGHRVLLIERSLKDRHGEWLDALVQSGAEMVGFSAYIWNIGALCETAAQLRLLCPDRKIVFGGAEVSYDSEEFLRDKPYIDHVICGEGEGAWLALAGGGAFARILDGNDFEAVDFRRAGILYDRYPAQPGQLLYYEGSRGCPYRCAYCLSAVAGRVRMKETATVLRELEVLGRMAVERGAGIVKLIDRTFNCDEARAEAIWQGILAFDFDCRYHFEIRAELLTDAAVELLRGHRGRIQLEVGVQSTCEKTLGEIQRGGDPDAGLRRLRELMAGEHPMIHADLIAGLPEEDYVRFGRSYDETYPLCDELQLGFLKLLHGSRLRERAADYGSVYNPAPPYQILQNDAMPYRDLRRLEAVADVAERLRASGGFEKTLRCLTNRIGAFALFEALADFLPDIRRLSQARLYESLYDWALTRRDVDAEEVRRLLADDYAAKEVHRLPVKLREKRE